MKKFAAIFSNVFWSVWDYCDRFFDPPAPESRSKLPTEEEFASMSPAYQQAWLSWAQKNTRLTSLREDKKKAQ